MAIQEYYVCYQLHPSNSLNLCAEYATLKKRNRRTWLAKDLRRCACLYEQACKAGIPTYMWASLEAIWNYLSPYGRVLAITMAAAAGESVQYKFRKHFLRDDDIKDWPTIYIDPDFKPRGTSRQLMPIEQEQLEELWHRQVKKMIGACIKTVTVR